MIASVLKPVDDVRSFWKIAQSIAKTHKYELNIIGNKKKNNIQYDNIHFNEHTIARTQWLRRLFIRYVIFRKILTIKPKILIIATHELMVIGILAKAVIRCKIIYDIQENYERNASMGGLYGRLLGKIIRLKESIFASWIDQFWLAEKCYQKELGFIKDRYEILQNKPLKFVIPDRDTEPIKALFSGTISDYSGAKIALQIMRGLAENFPDFKGKFIGQIHDPGLARWLQKEASSCTSIQLIISSEIIPYEDIIQGIQWANLGIISYLPNEVNEGKIPTKLYEYSRYQLPYLVQENTLWSRVGKRMGGAISFDFNASHSITDLTKILNSKAQQSQKAFPHNDTWEYESIKMINSINTLITGN